MESFFPGKRLHCFGMRVSRSHIVSYSFTVNLSICLSVRPSIHLSTYLPACLPACLPTMSIGVLQVNFQHLTLRCPWDGDLSHARFSVVFADRQTDRQTGRQAGIQTDRPTDQTDQTDKTRQDKTRQGKARQGKARQGKARQDKTRQDRQADRPPCSQTCADLFVQIAMATHGAATFQQLMAPALTQELLLEMERKREMPAFDTMWRNLAGEVEQGLEKWEGLSVGGVPPKEERWDEST